LFLLDPLAPVDQPDQGYLEFLLVLKNLWLQQVLALLDFLVFQGFLLFPGFLQDLHFLVPL